MPVDIIVPPDGGNQDPFFELYTNTFQQNVSWSALQDPPVLAPFTLALSKQLISNPVIKWEIVYPQQGMSWLNLTGASVSGDNITVGTTNSKTLTPVLVGVDTLPDGNYSAEIYFNSFDGTTAYSTISYLISLSIINNALVSISVDKSQYNVVFNRQTGVLSGDTVVQILNNTGLNSLDFKAQYFIEKSGFTTSFNLESLDIATNPNLPTHGTVNIQGKLNKGQSVVELFNIRLVIIDSGDLIVDKSNISFTIYKSTSQTASSSFSITNPENKNFTISAPYWITLSENSGNTSKTISITTVNSNAIAGGAYSGEIVISYDAKTIIISVDLLVISFINFMPDFDNDFCLDLPPITFVKIVNESVYVRITVTSTYVVLGKTTQKENVYFMPYSNNKAEFNFGEKVHNLFPKYKGHYFDLPNNTEIYKRINVDILAEELNSDYQVKYTESLLGVKCLPGKKPLSFPLLSDFIYRKRNQKSVFFNALLNKNTVYLRKIEDTNNIDSVSFGSTTVKYYEFPNQYSKIHLHFENNNLVPDWFTLTGEFKITNDFNHIYAKNIFKSQNEKYDLTKVKTLSINTGFFMKNELDLINKIVESLLCYVKIGDVVYRCFATTQKIILQDSTDELLDRDLEFLIVE